MSSNIFLNVVHKFFLLKDAVPIDIASQCLPMMRTQFYNICDTFTSG